LPALYWLPVLSGGKGGAIAGQQKRLSLFFAAVGSNCDSLVNCSSQQVADTPLNI